jgi:hypothetical protein
MAAIGRFRVVALDGDRVSIENEDGLRKTVLVSHVRQLEQSSQDRESK